jgi:hypothetical protein
MRLTRGVGEGGHLHPTPLSLMLIFNVAYLVACKHSVGPRSAGGGDGSSDAIAPSVQAAKVDSDAFTCELHVSKPPAAEPFGRPAILPWGEPSPEHARGTVLIAERIHRRLVVFEWDIAGGSEVRRVNVGPPGDYFDTSMIRDGDEVHLAAASDEEGPNGGRKIVHFVLDRSLHMLAHHPVGPGEYPVLMVADGVVAVASLESQGSDFQGHLRTFSYPIWAPLATLEFPSTEGTVAALRSSGARSLVAQFSTGGQTKLVVYDARTLERGATWGPIDGDYTMGVVQGHTALLGNGALTEFSDSVGILGSRPMAGTGDFMEDPETGAIATVRGEVLLHGKVTCCVVAYAGVVSTEESDRQTVPCLDRAVVPPRFPTRFDAIGVMSHGNVVILQTLYDDPWDKVPRYNHDRIIWFDARAREPVDAAPP